MKKIVFGLIIVCFSMFVITGCAKKEKNKEENKDNNMYLERYEEIKKDFEEGLKWNLTVSCPNCCLDSNTSYKQTITSNYLVQQGYIKKDILLDVDKESYCKVYADTDCSDGKIVYDIYLKCNNYIDEGYIDWN